MSDLTIALTLNDLFRRWFRENEDAVHFALQAWDAAQLWDDLIDEGKCRDVNALLAWLAFDKEEHPFFSIHAARLRPVMRLVYQQWAAANVMERSGDARSVDMAWMLRAGVYSLFHDMAAICGGDAWAREVGPEIYLSYAETLTDFREEMKCLSR